MKHMKLFPVYISNYYSHQGKPRINAINHHPRPSRGRRNGADPIEQGEYS
jgi:hypothetical protein